MHCVTISTVCTVYHCLRKLISCLLSILHHLPNSLANLLYSIHSYLASWHPNYSGGLHLDILSTITVLLSQCFLDRCHNTWCYIANYDQLGSSGLQLYISLILWECIMHKADSEVIFFTNFAAFQLDRLKEY